MTHQKASIKQLLFFTPQKYLTSSKTSDSIWNVYQTSTKKNKSIHQICQVCQQICFDFAMNTCRHTVCAMCFCEPFIDKCPICVKFSHFVKKNQLPIVKE